MSFLDFIFPKKCINCRKLGDFLCADCFAKIRFNEAFQCPVCLRSALDGMTHPGCLTKYSLDGAISTVVYGSIVKKLIYQFKYKPNLSKLSKTIGELMTEGLSQNESFYMFVEKYKPIVIPIPLSSKRLRERGYNHAELLASYVAQYFKLKVHRDVLVRVKDTKPQYKLNKEERIKNIEGAFEVAKNANPPAGGPSSIILVDDIATSFATLREAAKVLKHRGGARQILGVTFAREV